MYPLRLRFALREIALFSRNFGYAGNVWRYNLRLVLEKGYESGMSIVLSGDMLFSYAEAFLNAAKRLALMENWEYSKGDC